MASSGQYSFNPAASDLVLTAFSRCGKSGAVLTPEHLRMAETEANLLNVEWGNRGVNLWESKLIQFPTAAQLTKAVGAYLLPATTISVLLVYIQTGTGQAINDRVLGPMSTTEWAAIPNPLTQGPPTTYWYDRQIVPVLNLWPQPDSSTTYTGFARCLTQIQDVVLPRGVTLDTPYRFLDAFTAGVSKRLAMHYAPERVADLGMEYERQWEFATVKNTEDAPLSFSPQLGPYFRM